MDYLFRMVDSLLKSNLETFGATLVEGPKWCGKTTTCKQLAKSVLELQDPDTLEVALQNARVKPSLLLQGETPRLIDEWQTIPVVWDTVRVAVDRRISPGQFILTGSNAVNERKIKHTGTGRITRMKMYPMSLYESRDSVGSVSLKQLFDDSQLDIDGLTSSLTIERLVFLACRGGWPATLSVKNANNQLRIARDYVNSVCRTDISTIEGLDSDVEARPRRRDEMVAHAILRSYARNISTLAKRKSILEDVQSQVEGLSDKALDDYLYALRRLFVIEDVQAWCPAIRSAAAIRSSIKREFTDPSIAVAALGLTPEQLLLDMKTFGFIFETLCIRDLRAYSQALGGTINYYHDRYGLEADIVLHLEDGRYALIECKLGARDIDDGAAHLLKLKQLVREHNEKERQVPIREPDLMIILTGGQMAYRRQDGVLVIPIGCLKD